VTDDLLGWQRKLRAQFPIVTANPSSSYLDSAATAQKPQAVLDAVLTYLTTENANASRGTYPWANRTTALIAAAASQLREFLDDRGSSSSVHFLSGTTEGLRSIADDWLAPSLRPGDEIIVPFADHSANIVPWEAVALRSGASLVPMPYDFAHDYDIDRLASLIGPRTRMIAATHVHHVYGNDMNVPRLRRVAGPDIPICLDAAQSFGHLPISVTALDVDFVVFSGHKAMALPGVGAVWARNFRGSRYAPAGWSGTPNTAGIVSLAAAMSWLSSAGLADIARWNTALCARLTDGLSGLPAYEILGCQDSLPMGSPVQRRAGIVTFRHRGISSNDLGFILAADGFMVRSDGMCQGADGERDPSVRVSPHVYTSFEEIDRLVAALSALA
jgi:cysteine desulfurase/selenocysteine lyase